MAFSARREKEVRRDTPRVLYSRRSASLNWKNWPFFFFESQTIGIFLGSGRTVEGWLVLAAALDLEVYYLLVRRAA